MARIRSDRHVVEAKQYLMANVFNQMERVNYERQLQVLCEDKFFHWITSAALAELRQEGTLKSELMVLLDKTRIRFYWRKGLRSWRRKANRIAEIVRRYSAPEFAIAIGQHGETMFDAALPRAGFMYKARNVREYNGKTTSRLKNLDRVFELDGISYGVEIKNKLDYI